jgi:hypothetical protein
LGVSFFPKIGGGDLRRGIPSLSQKISKIFLSQKIPKFPIFISKYKTLSKSIGGGEYF